MKTFFGGGILCVIFAVANGQSLTVSNAASYQQSVAISPGTIVAVKGSNLTNVTAQAPDSTHPPTTLGGVTLTVNGIASGLYYVSPTQINAVIDPSVAAGLQTIALQSPTLNTQNTVLIQAPTSAGIFTLNGTGSGDGAIVNPSTGNEGAFSVVTNGGPTFLSLFLTSFDTTTMPTVWVGGTAVTVQYYGTQGTYPGMQQINAQLPASLQGVGRVELVVEQNGRRSNAVETVLLPQQTVFFDDQPNHVRSRELSAIAWIPGTKLALVADENDDVVRVVDFGQRAVTHVIALPDGAQPEGIGVNATGTLAVVSEKARGSVALLDLTAYKVINEFPTGYGASALAVAGDQAVITNSDADTVSFFSFSRAQVAGTTPSGRLPRGVAVDSQYAYVTNQSDGTVTMFSLTTHLVANTISLGEYVRPAAIQVLQNPNLAVIAEPSAGPGGKLIVMQLPSGQFTSVNANPANTGGASSIIASGNQIYLANQSGASVTTSPLSLVFDSSGFVSKDVQLTPVNIAMDAGARSLALDSTDGLLLTLCEADGQLVVTDLGNNTVASRINAVRVSSSDNSDDHSDRLAAPNMPTISTAAPSTANGASTPVTVNMTLIGTNLTNASSVLFIDPATVPSLAPGTGNVNRGNFGASDPALTVSSIKASPDGTQLTLQVQIAPGTSPRTRVIRVLTPNGETSLTNTQTTLSIL